MLLAYEPYVFCCGIQFLTMLEVARRCWAQPEMLSIINVPSFCWPPWLHSKVGPDKVVLGTCLRVKPRWSKSGWHCLFCRCLHPIQVVYLWHSTHGAVHSQSRMELLRTSSFAVLFIAPFFLHSPRAIRRKSVPTVVDLVASLVSRYRNVGRVWLISRDWLLLLVPRTHNKLGDRSFSAAGPRLWNDLPPCLRQPGLSFDSFRRSLKTSFWQLKRLGTPSTYRRYINNCICLSVCLSIYLSIYCQWKMELM